jgi:hypothetical protein
MEATIMRKLVTTALTLLLAAGCFPQAADDSEFKSAIPPENSIQIAVPGGSQAIVQPGQPGVGSHDEALLGQTADFYAITRLTSERVNGDVGFVLAVLWTIVHFPASQVSGNTAVWGPFTPTLSPVNYQLVVTRVAQGQFTYHLDGRPKASTSSADFQAIISGSAAPSTPVGRGSGNFELNLTVAHQLDPVGTMGQGTVDVTYDFGSNPKTIQVHFANVADASDQPVTADYMYDRFDDDSGDFQFDAHGNMVGGATQLEDGIIRSRWNASGAGRADARVSGGDAGTGLTATECWDSNFQRVYFQTQPAIVQTEGVASACVYADQLLPNL